MRLPKLMRQVTGAFLYKILLAPLVLRKVEACYERYLSDSETAEHFARTYLPSEMLNGKGRQVLDFGCGRGRHAGRFAGWTDRAPGSRAETRRPTSREPAPCGRARADRPSTS